MCVVFARDSWCGRPGLPAAVGDITEGDDANQVAAVSVSPVGDRASIYLRSQCPELYAEAYQSMACLASSCRERLILEAPSR
jgi:hypothetical protein